MASVISVILCLLLLGGLGMKNPSPAQPGPSGGCTAVDHRGSGR